jgi:hypothetical protein
MMLLDINVLGGEGRRARVQIVVAIERDETSL